MKDGVDWKLVQTIFGEALDRPASERPAFVAERCRDDSDMLAEIESLLRHHEQSGDDFMRPPPAVPPPCEGGQSRPTVPPSRGDHRGVAPQRSPAPADPLIGRDVGGFLVERVIAAGGMGTVYLAKQQQPHRPVALKLLRAGIASESALRRFEYESEILARLRHPNVAEVYEAGTYLGLPYFVMEYIADARTITEFAAAAGLSQRDRLRLFEQVCEAVHYGHQRGVIHRDLKPSNILVDADGRVRVIDFGVARATDADITLTTLHTGTGELVGTLQYMSPEQCDGDPHEIDVRSDVYSLGLVLYKLLCGRPPYEVNNLTVASAARVICEQEPPRPSSVTGKKRSGTESERRAAGFSPRGLEKREGDRSSEEIASVEGVSSVDGSKSGSRSAARAEARGSSGVTDTPEFSNPGILEPSAPVRGDLERIVLKSLEKDRRQRYQSAADLLRDIRHYLNREPIEAKPPTLWTRTLRWVARHPAWATTATCLTIAAMVFAAAGVSVWWYNEEPYKLLLCDAAGKVVVSPQRETSRVKAVEARLIARSQAELASWTVRKPGCIDGGYLIERPREFERGKLVILAFCNAFSSYPEYGNALVAFDASRGFDDPIWIRRLEAGEPLPVPAYAADREYYPDDFSPKIMGACDIFSGSEHPGDEVIVLYLHNPYSQRILRIHNLRAEVLYEVWHDGGISQCYWMEEQRLLICVGTNGTKRWDEMGRSGIDMPHPRVLFAIRPEAESVQHDFLSTQYGDGPLNPAWYRWFSHPEILDADGRSVSIYLHAPVSSRHGNAVCIALELSTARGAGIRWEIDAHGQEIPGTRVVSDVYKQNLNEHAPGDIDRLPEPNAFQLHTWPPTNSE